MQTLSNLTQAEKLARFFFMVGGELTAAQASARYGIANLRARVRDLRKAGINIQTTMRFNKDQGSRVGYYSLPNIPDVQA